MRDPDKILMRLKDSLLVIVSILALGAAGMKLGNMPVRMDKAEAAIVTLQKDVTDVKLESVGVKKDVGYIVEVIRDARAKGKL